MLVEKGCGFIQFRLRSQLVVAHGRLVVSANCIFLLGEPGGDQGDRGDSRSDCMQLGECNRPVQELSGGLDRISRESRGDQARKSGAG